MTLMMHLGDTLLFPWLGNVYLGHVFPANAADTRPVGHMAGSKTMLKNLQMVGSQVVALWRERGSVRGGMRG